MSTSGDVKIVSKVLFDETLLETIYDLKKDETKLIVKKVNRKPMIKKNGYKYQKVTYFPSDNPGITKGVVKLPSGYESVDEPKDLISQISDVLKKYVDLGEFYYEIVARYILMTWVYDRFEKIPYLGASGPWGTGKSRFLNVVSLMAYHGTILGANVTSPTLFRWLDTCPGTLFLDEADFAKSEKNDPIIQVLNTGFDKNLGFVYRNEKKGDEYVPTPYVAFGPKVLAHRQPYDDDAFESRFIKIEMTQKSREDVPITLPVEFQTEAASIRNKLLGFRLEYFHKIDSQTKIEGVENIEPRICEVIAPLIWVTGECRLPKAFDKYLEISEETRKIQLSQGVEGVLAQIIFSMVKDGKKLMLDAITKDFNSKKVLANPLGNREVSKQLRGIGITSKRSNKGYYVICSSEQLENMQKRYGLSDLED